MASKQVRLSLFDAVFGKVRMKKWAKAFFECIVEPKTAREIMGLCKIKDVSNAKKHLNEAVKEGFLYTWTDKGVRYWYVSDEILKRLTAEGMPSIQEFKGIKGLNTKSVSSFFDVCLKLNPKGLKKSRKLIYQAFKARYG